MEMKWSSKLGLCRSWLASWSFERAGASLCCKMYSWPDHARQSAVESAAVSGFPHWWVSWQRWIWSCEILKLCSYLMSCWCSGDIGSEPVRQQRFGQQWLCLPIDSWSYCWWDRRWWAMDHGWTNGPCDDSSLMSQSWMLFDVDKMKNICFINK